MQRTSICQRRKDKNSTAVSSMPEKPPGPPSSLWSHGHSSAMPADDKIFGSGFLLNPMGTADHSKGILSQTGKRVALWGKRVGGVAPVSLNSTLCLVGSQVLLATKSD